MRLRIPPRARLPLAAAAMLALVPLVTLPQISARVSGEEYLLRVAPVDPIDPFRGTYVALSYPDLNNHGSTSSTGGMGSMEDGERGRVYITLKQDGRVWRAAEWTRHRPSGVPYLSCEDSEWAIHCGIESWFVPQSEAESLGRDVNAGRAVARVKIDDRGHAAIVGLELSPRPPRG